MHLDLVVPYHVHLAFDLVNAAFDLIQAAFDLLQELLDLCFHSASRRKSSKTGWDTLYRKNNNSAARGAACSARAVVRVDSACPSIIRKGAKAKGGWIARAIAATTMYWLVAAHSLANRGTREKDAQV